MDRLVLVLSVFLLILRSPVALEQREVTIPCDVVTQDLSPCLSYLSGGGQASSPTKDCCQGANDVFKHFGQSKSERQGVCRCLVSELPYVDNPINGTLVSALPGKCGINIKLPPISNNFDCSKVN